MFQKFTTPSKETQQDDKCGVCGEEAGEDSFIIKKVIHCFDCYEEVMDDCLFG